jgi:exopolysaccharide biosynthesis polyprenyl glycosylphosphotransferase
MTAKERTSLDRDIRDILNELNDRRSHHSVSRLKQVAWRVTVRGTYIFKRFADLVISELALIALSPLFLLLAIVIKLTSRGPVFFVQVRVGRYGRHFRFYKFRSMYVDAEERKKALLAQNQSADGVIFKMKNDPRITPVGKLLRRTSMDELPQLLNVLFGDMSLVGPRPPVPSEVQQYTMNDRKRLEVKPGLTCLWQVSGRSDIPFKQQVRLDQEYIRAMGIKNDLVILLRTIPAILTGKGAY